MAIALLFVGLAAISLQSVPPSQKVPAPPPAQAQALNPPAGKAAKPKRVITDLSTLHLKKVSSPANQTPGASRGTSATLTLCSPATGATVSVAPLFEWTTSANPSTKVVFSLLTSSGDIVEELDAAGDSLQYPSEAPPLKPGQIYSWKVSGGGLDKLPDPVIIEVLKPSAALASQLTASGPDPLAQAQVYLRAGFWYDTIATLRTGLAITPRDPALNEQLHLLLSAVGCTATL